MAWRAFIKRFQALVWRNRVEREVDEELSAHIEFQTRKYIAQGMTREEAQRRARIAFGGVEQTREQCREVDRWRAIDASARNLKHTFRSLAKSPAFALVSIFILTVGIGSNLAVFSTMDALLLRPLPVERPQELLNIGAYGDHGDPIELPSTAINVLKDNRALQGLCGFNTSLPGVEIDGNMRSIGVAGFTGDCFNTLGLHLQLGRAITPADDHLGTGGVAVIADSLWQNTFGGRADVLGKTLKIEGQIYTIVGVTQKGFTGLLLGFPEPIMIPNLQWPRLLPDGTRPRWHWVNILARRTPSVSEAQASASVKAQRTQILQESVPQHYNAVQRKKYLSQKISAISGSTGVDYWLRRRFGEPLYSVFGICAALLLIACVNLTSLLLARSLNRRREVAIRLAVGAKRSHIAGLFVLENAILVIVGTLAGILAGFAIARAILAKGDAMFGNFRLNIGFDTRVFVFLVSLIMLVVAIFAIASVWQAGRLASSDALKECGRGVIATNSFAQKALLGIQLALTLAFVTASALFGASLKNMYGIHFGIDTRNLWEVAVAERPNNTDTTNRSRDLLQSVEQLPNVQSASLTDFVPFWFSDIRDPVAIVENAHIGEVKARIPGVSDNFFRTLGAKIIAGEDFRRNDSKSGEPTAILSESLARYFGNPRDLIGRHVRVSGWDPEYQRLKVIGIASDTDMNLANLEDTKPFALYVNFWQHKDAQGYPVVLIKTRDQTLPLGDIRRIVRQRGYQYVDRATTINTEIDTALVENRFVAYLSGAFGMLALMMAAVGLFGLLSYQVSNRTSEIGVRLALGAQRVQIRWLVLQQILKLLAWGSAAGIALTIALQKWIAGLLYGVTTYNASLLLFSIAVLAATALIAAWIPVRRASSIDPMQALRHE